MKLISTIFPGDQIEATLTIQSRVSRQDRNDKTKVNGPLIVRYKSKIGNESLIFNPTVALVLQGKADGRTDPNKSVWVPLNQFYRFTACLSHVYQKLHTEKLYTLAEGVLYMDRKMAVSVARKISLFRNTLVIYPATTTDRMGKPTKAIELTVDSTSIGILEHTEALELIDIIDHFDVTTFSLLAGLVDELAAIDNKLDYMLAKIEGIESLLQQGGQKEQQQSNIMSAFKWEIADA